VFMARFVLSVGCGAYDNGDLLPGAINDAKEFYRLQTDEKLGEANVQGSSLLLNPTLPELQGEISNFFARLTATDEYFIFFAGHAHRAKTSYTFRCKNTRPRSAFDGLSYRELKLSVNKTGARGTLIFDTCYSGEVGNQAEYLSRGESDDQKELPPPDAPGEGTILIWSCDSEAKAYENREHGIFSQYFFEGIRCGANIPSRKEQVTAGTLVKYVVETLVKRRHEGSFPSLRMSGDIAGMFVSKNPRYAIDQDPGRLSKSRSSVDPNPALSERSAEGIQKLAKSILRKETVLVSRRSANPHPLQANLFFIPMIGCEVYFSQTIGSNILITENGFYHGAASGGVVFVWEIVENVETYTSSYSPSFTSPVKDVTIHFRPALEAKIKMKEYTISNNKHPLLDQAIEWGRSYTKSRWKVNVVASKPPVRGREVAIIAPLNYVSMRPIPASKNDISDVARVLSAHVPATSPVTVSQFKTSLRAAFESAYRKTLVLYYSGHGILFEGELFLTAEYSVPDHPLETALPLFKLLDLMSECQVINLVLILDCCYSGSAGDNLGLSFDELDPSLERFFDDDQIAITIIASSGRGEESFHTPTNSVFTDAFVRAMSMARSEKSRVTVGALIGMIPKVTTDQRQRMRVFSSQQAEDVDLADEVEDAANLELAKSAARQDRKTDQIRKLRQVDFRLFQGEHFELQDIQIFRKEPVGLRSRIIGLGLAFIAIGSVFMGWEMIRDEHAWVYGALVAAFGLITFGPGAWILITDTDKNHYMLLGDAGVLIREGKTCEAIPALSLMSIQVQKSYSMNTFRGASAESRHTYHLLVLDEGQPVRLPYWLADSSMTLAIKGVNELIDSTNRTLVN
jgi:uncharacterized caspase-like protein